MAQHAGVRVVVLFLLFACFFSCSSVLAKNSNVHTTYHWHLEQPIYWPARIPTNKITYQKAWDSIQLAPSQGGHPENNLQSIFSKPDRVAAYQSRLADAINTCSNVPDMGAQVSYSGCLIENINNLANNNQLGYSSGWNNDYKNARKEKTSGGFPKMDLVSFTYHHVLAPLVNPKVLRMELEIHKIIYNKTWIQNGGSGPAYSKGLFPAEMAFSERIIPTLVQAGLDWVMVPNNHISRACSNYAFSPSGDNNDPPNKADAVNPPQQNWFRMSVSRGCTPNNAVPYSYTPHYAQHVDPQTGQVYKMIVVPAAMAMSWQDGYECYSTNDIQGIASHNDPDHPMLVLLAHDGDNAFGGGYSYYMQCVQNFVNQAVSNGYQPTTIQQYLNDFPVDPNDIVHVEDGAWINADGDFGAPQFINWNWPLIDNNGNFDIPNGWAVDERNWAVITAGENAVLTADQMSGGVRIPQVQQPDSSATDAELAWHFFLPSMTSGYMYYGAILDMPVKETIACNIAVQHASSAINAAIQKGATDQTPPSIWAPQRLPWNPGGYGAGSLWHYKYTPMNTTFYVWTFIYDISGVSSVQFFYRQDADGVNPLNDNANEVYEPEKFGLTGVGPWQSMQMVNRQFPKGNHSNVDFFILPTIIADEYWVQVKGFNNVLLDYYIQATDKKGNVAKSDIYHVWIGK